MRSIRKGRKPLSDAKASVVQGLSPAHPSANPRSRYETSCSRWPQLTFRADAMSRLLEAQRLDRVHTGRPPRRIGAEPQSDAAAGRDRRPDPEPWNDGRHLEEHADAVACGNAKDNADDGAHLRDEDRLQQKLDENVSRAGADTLADADLAGSLRRRPA